jgi:hypothetical protein
MQNPPKAKNTTTVIRLGSAIERGAGDADRDDKDDGGGDGRRVGCGAAEVFIFTCVMFMVFRVRQVGEILINGNSADAPDISAGLRAGPSLAPNR